MTLVLIIGATGVLGNAATKELLKNNLAVRAFVRNKNNAAEIEKAGAEIFIGDLNDPFSIAEACKGTDIIITAAHGMVSKGKNKSKNVDDLGHKSLIDSALRSGVKHFIYTSVNGVSQNHPIDFFRTKYEIEQYLVNSGLNYTILRLAAFMEWHVDSLLGKSIREKGKTTILGVGDNPTNFIAVHDIVQVLRLIVRDESYYKKTLNIGGPENISRNKVANLYGQFLKIKPRVKHIPVPVINILSYLIRPFHSGIGRILQLSAHNDKADATMNSSDSIQQFGLSPTTIEAFIREQVRQTTGL
jgi:uncharacterized protein YbjT (DUF2867 family)